MPSLDRILAVTGVLLLLAGGIVTLGPFGIPMAQGPDPQTDAGPGTATDSTPSANDIGGQAGPATDTATEVASGNGGGTATPGVAGQNGENEGDDKDAKKEADQNSQNEQDENDHEGKGSDNSENDGQESEHGPPEDNPGRGPPDHARNDENRERGDDRGNGKK